MSWIHVTPAKNIRSIMTEGLVPQENFMDHSFWARGISAEDDLSYFWSSYQRRAVDRFVPDMVYCKLFLDPRNEYIGETEELNKYYRRLEKVHDLEDRIFARGRRQRYYVLEAREIGEREASHDRSVAHHVQIPGQGGSMEYLRDDFAHEDKVLGVTDEVVPPEDLRVVDVVDVDVEMRTVNCRFRGDVGEVPKSFYEYGRSVGNRRLGGGPEEGSSGTIDIDVVVSD